MRSVLWTSCAGGCALVGLAAGLSAQVSLTLSQAPSVFPAPAVADFNVGVIADPTEIVFTVNVTGGAASTSHTSTVSVRASSATLGGGKALGDLEWRRSDLATWTPMTTSDATIESRPVQKNRTNDPWSNAVLLRVHLAWATDAPATYATGLVFTLTMTTP